MKTKQWLTILGIAAGSTLLEICMTPLRYDFLVSGIIGLFLYGLGTYLCLSQIKQIRPNIVAIAIIAGLLAIHLPVRIMDWQGSLVSFPDAVIHLLGIILGYAFWRVNKKVRVFLIIPLSILISVGYVYFFDAFLNKLNYGTWSGKIEPVTVEDRLVFQTSDGDSVNLTYFKGHYLVLDFWSSSCGVCFKKFPQVQEFYDRYRDNGQVTLYGIHCRMEERGETYDTGADVLHNLGYTFPCMSINIKDSALSEIGVEAFPTVIIVAPDGTIVFRSDISGAQDYISKLAGE